MWPSSSLAPHLTHHHLQAVDVLLAGGDAGGQVRERAADGTILKYNYNPAISGAIKGAGPAHGAAALAGAQAMAAGGAAAGAGARGQSGWDNGRGGAAGASGGRDAGRMMHWTAHRYGIGYHLPPWA